MTAPTGLPVGAVRWYIRFMILNMANTNRPETVQTLLKIKNFAEKIEKNT